MLLYLKIKWGILNSPHKYIKNTILLTLEYPQAFYEAPLLLKHLRF